jgi:hypothetical protein
MLKESLKLLICLLCCQVNWTVALQDDVADCLVVITASKGGLL